ncbi:uncharacterized protein LOC108669074 [Hyalella azteca]|uniref:Uncharacterized protein LOC108669074 n=1 Tax=Hyalella azteca TaxID=294128 RepID=A0A8B7NE12_HYAAZ|nr:uncharacterized protein LOC108669074 [Hyalella azteca]
MYDPIGFVSPVTLGGRLILRRILSESDELPDSRRLDWDDPLPEEQRRIYPRWLASLDDLRLLTIPRCFLPQDLAHPVSQTLHVFADASQDAIGCASYLRSTDNSGDAYVAFVRGESRVAPRAATSIPRLELCAAVEAVMSAQQILRELKSPPQDVYFYSDSKVVLAYINSESGRFTRYVQRRLTIIKQVSRPEQWSYVPSTSNPADFASRATEPRALQQTSWLRGPEFLRREIFSPDSHSPTDFSELEPLPETDDSPVSTALIASSSDSDETFSALIRKLSSWPAALRIATRVVSLCRGLVRKMRQKQGEAVHKNFTYIEARTLVHNIIIREAQTVAFPQLMSTNEPKLGPWHRLAALAPFRDEQGLLRVGGRLGMSELPREIKHPLLLPAGHPIITSILRHHHNLTKHQGRHVTHSAVREAGYHIENGRRAIQKLLQGCVTCRRLRASCEAPQMASLPQDRVLAAPPFSAVGIDVFGPWMISHGQTTRRTSSLMKCWAVIFTCLASRGVHIECLPSLDTPTFINAFRRFVAIRGGCSTVRSDRDTNFIGAKNQDEGINVEQASRCLLDHGATWLLNPPHASHFGGAWERKIGQVFGRGDVARHSALNYLRRA